MSNGGLREIKFAGADVMPLNSKTQADRIKKYFDIVIQEGLYSNRVNLNFYLGQLFEGVDFHDKAMLDVGGGDGLFSFYAASRGVKSVICLEPEEEGSTSGVVDKFRKVKGRLSFLDQVKLVTIPLQDFDASSFLGSFDIILLHYSINHLDEDACVNLHKDEHERQKYKMLLRKLYDIANEEAKLIVTDCSRYNLFAVLGIRNPLAPAIEWHKHQSPELWAKLLEEVGFCNPVIRWRSLDQLRSLGKILFANKWAAFFQHSLFFLTMDKKGLKK